MNILSSSQIKTVDALTIERQAISSTDLMERAAERCTDIISREIPFEAPIVVCCGKGNNGGDGLAIARLLKARGYAITVILVHHTERFSDDAQINFGRLSSELKANLVEIRSEKDIDRIELTERHTVIDALLGTGINKPMTGILKAMAGKINTSPCHVISIDVPSGLLTDGSSAEFTESCVHADLVLSLQLPKLAYLMPENRSIVPDFRIVDIGLDEHAIAEQKSVYYYAVEKEIRALLTPRNKFSHKGTYGHALLFAGSKGKPGAAIIAAEACLRSGAGLLTVHSTQQVTGILSFRLPEAMTQTDEHDSFITSCGNLETCRAIGFGPGTGTAEETQHTLKSVIQQFRGNLVIDADGLNILSENKTWLEFLPAGTILTPHPKEFERLAGSFENDFDRLQKAKHFSTRHGCILILKDTYTHVCMPDGSVVFNSTGNPGLAKGGSGDCLTGIILGLLTRGYAPAKAALIGTYIHGMAADLCAKDMSMESILISDVTGKLPAAFKVLETGM